MQKNFRGLAGGGLLYWEDRQHLDIVLLGTGGSILYACIGDYILLPEIYNE